MISALDHVAVVVRDLDKAVAAYTALLGRTPNWIGGDGGARHAWFQFPNMALDVIAPYGEGAFGDRLRVWLESHDESVWALAFTAPDISAAHTLLRRRGIRASEPGPVRSTHDDGRRRYWTTAMLDAEATAGVPIMMIAPPRDGQPWPLSSPTEDEASAVAALDHVVVNTPNPDRALALYGAKLNLDLRLDRSNPEWGSRLLFFRCGDAVVEIGSSLKTPVSDGPDRFGGLAWRVTDAAAAQARIAKAGFDVSEVRKGRKPGTFVFTVRSGVPGAPALMLQPSPSQGTD